MTQPTNLAMTLSLNDRLVGPLQRSLGLAQKQLRDLSRELISIGKDGTAAAQGLGQIGRSADQLRGATDEMRKLSRETKEVERGASRLMNVWSRLSGVTRGIGSVTAGAAAFSSVVAAPIRRAADYDTQLRSLSNTAFAGSSLDVRRAGMRSLDQSVTAAVRFGGGTRDGAIEALNELVASGVFRDPAEAARLLPLLQRGSTASGASAVDLARIAIRGQQTFGIPSDQVGTMLDQAMAAGQAGGFELRDMAKWLPQQMAAARQLGLSGPEGMIRLLAANQASVITAGTRDEAGNNLVNLLAKVNSQDTARDFGRLGIDLPGSLAAARGKGVDGLTGFVNMIDQLVAGDSRFQAARRGAASAGNDTDRRAALDAQADILQGSAVGTVVQDRQALMALVALMNNRGYMADVEKRIRGGAGATGDAFALFREGSGFAFDQREFEIQKAQTDAMGAANGALSKLAEAQTDLYRRYPGFASVIEGAKVAVMGFTGALIASGLVNIATRGGIGAVAGAGVAGASSTAAAVGGISGAGAAGLAVGGIGLSATAANIVANNPEAFKPLLDNPMLGAMGGDTSLAAAILQAEPDPAPEARNAAIDTANRSIDVRVHVTTDSPAFTATVMEQTARDARRN